MVGVRKNALTAKQCLDIINTAELTGFKLAGLRDNSGDSYYDENYRKSSVSFIKQDNLSIDVWNAIYTTILSLNEEYYNAKLTNFDMQLAWYQAGELGFEWHRDDPPYPTETQIWSGRKLTYVFELSNESDYEGGYLAVDPDNNRDEQKNILNLNSHTPQSNIFRIPATYTQSNPKRTQGDCVVFPSFFNHKVYPITSGNRYSLTVWAKGPLWV